MAGFGKGFGGQVGAMLGPNATKAGLKNQSKKSSLFGRPPGPILMNFWWILAPTWGGQGVDIKKCMDRSCEPIPTFLTLSSKIP